MTTRKAEQSARTRASLVAAARKLFAELGFARAGTELILSRLEVTRGALYHQFPDKTALFEAVCEQVHGEVAAAIEAAASRARDPGEALELGCAAFLDALAQPEARRILVTDAPSVLGWERWNAMDRRHGFRLLVGGLEAAMEAGRIRPQPAEALAILINGALNHAALWVGEADTARRLRRAKAAVRELLASLAAPP